MRPIAALTPQLQALDGQDYGAYQSLKGAYDCGTFQLLVDRIPKDPYAPPGTGVYRVRIPRSGAGFPERCFASPARQLALRDFLARQVYQACLRHCPGRRGTGSSGIITITQPGQEILDRSSLQVDGKTIEARIFLGLPAKGRKIDATTACSMVFDELPRIVEDALVAANLDPEALERHLETYEDAEHLRAQLNALGLVAFIADGAMLPRQSGIDARPLQAETVVPFTAPESLRVRVELPHAGTVTGMGIPAGVTLIVGGGYHGKSTLLQALELGVYSHIPGDGRELCVCVSEAVKIRAASGRSVSATDISAFINHLPLGQDTGAFSTENASGSTSQAAFIAESIEAGAHLLLMDEDTCAANFMIRDGRMQQLVAREQEPITAYVDRVRTLYDRLGVSTILVMGGSGDYFQVAGCVIQMLNFQPLDVTARAREIAAEAAAGRTWEDNADFPPPAARLPDCGTLSPMNEFGHFRITARDTRTLVYGRHEIDLADVEQLTEEAQLLAVGRGIDHAKQYLDGGTSLREGLAQVMADIRREGLDVLDPKRTGNLSGFRGLELAAALNRLRGLEVRHQER